MHFNKLTVKEVIQETNNCVSVAFEIPAALKETFQYTQGQYITLKAVIDGNEIRRSYSLCSSPLEDDYRVAIKHVDGGIFSTYANKHLKSGDVLEVMPPAGKFFTPLNSANQKKYVAIAAGSGITPILSIIKTILATEPKSHFTLVYGNKSTSSIIFKEALEALKNKYVQRFTLIHILSKEQTDAAVNYGRINAEKLQQLSAIVNYQQTDEFFICGPEEMIFTTKDYIAAQGVDAKKIHFELFTSSAPKKQINTSQSVIDAKSSCAVTIKADGRSLQFNLPLNSDNILDAALQNGADLPYACKGGVCCTCKAKLVKGEVKMDVHWGLEADEIANGFILTCQSHPITPEVVVDFDEK